MPRTLSTLEALEPRIAPANVAAVLTDGMLIVEPINSLAGVTLSVVQVDAATFEVFDDGASLGTIAEVEALRVLGSAAKDRITLDLLDTVDDRFMGEVVLQSRGGRHDVVVVEGGWLGGDLRVRVAQDAFVFVNDGAFIDGTLRLVAVGSFSRCRLAGHFGEVVVDGPEEIDFVGAEVDGDLRVTGRSRHGTDIALLDGTEVAGAFRVTNAAEQSVILAVLASTVDGPLDLQFGNGSHALQVQDSFLGNTVTMQGGLGNDECSFSGTEVRGEVRLGLAAGDHSVQVRDGSSFAAGISVSGNRGAVRTHLSISDSTIAGVAAVRATAGGVLLESFGASLLGGINVHGADQNTNLNTDGTSVLAGRVEYQGGTGRNRLEIGSVGDLFHLDFAGGDKHDYFALYGTGGEFLTVVASFAGGNDQVTMQTGDILRVRLDGGPGGDFIVSSPGLTGPGVTIVNFESIE